MCGLIAVRALSAAADLHQRASRALASLARRGPDAEGLLMVETAPPTLLGHRRLAILDTSSAAEQPMRCPVSGTVLVFNGAIYNFVELRAELRALGCVFVTDGDTEVLLHGWRVWGEGLFSRCNGMWAVVIWDAPSGDLVYSRDRLGVKPLYLHYDGQQMVLASEVGAIAQMLGGYPAPNPEKLFDFLLTGFSEQGTATFFQGVRAVPPGVVGRMSRAGRFSQAPYHQWPEPGSAKPLSSLELRGLVEDAVHLRLQADVPVASLLSGGLDSSIITQVALNASQQPRQRLDAAFTYGYRDAEQVGFDESARAALFMAEAGHSDRHHVLRFVPIPAADELMNLVTVQGEPFSTPSALASFRTYRAIAEQGVKVVLSGEGADELFGGYSARYHSVAARDELWSGQLVQVAHRLRRRTFPVSLLFNRLVWDLPLALIGPLLRRHRPSVGVMSSGLWESQQQRLAMVRQRMSSPLEQRMREDQLDNLLPMALRVADRNSMSAGIELRSPFMDHRLVERAFRTPALERIGAGLSKALLRDAFKGRLPDRLVTTPKSTGFGHAEQFLVTQLPWRELLEDLPPELNDFIDLNALRRHLARPQCHSTLWLALSVALWYRSIYA
ncbi:Asparagine synthetase [glutamine-hydrolyzing] 1 [Pseudomonas extremaustralis]|uniref:asparagine synthase (glutamine-hydrolyzing) n=1 Tax=Pseudomonas extremaustralis TaxID=359110 RepID=UPI002AA0E2F3|nr:asparagine synthase (glutamine-hydrolyzing) [Pseudomonas extremaustralis]MDY7068765.1 Asparagine synthetase [glutamine-hydrolyzing] 1 [Pseudomonas extremaustralis]